MVYPSSVTGKARIPSAIGKLFDVRQMIALLATRDLPTTLRPGNASSHARIVPLLLRLVPRLQAAQARTSSKSVRK